MWIWVLGGSNLDGIKPMTKRLIVLCSYQLSHACTWGQKIIFYSTLRISGGGPIFKTHAEPKKKLKPSEITCEKLELPRYLPETFLRSRKEKRFVGKLGLVQFPKNSFKILYTAEGLLYLVKKASFWQEFWCEFHSGWVGISPVG